MKDIGGEGGERRERGRGTIEGGEVGRQRVKPGIEEAEGTLA